MVPEPSPVPGNSAQCPCECITQLSADIPVLGTETAHRGALPTEEIIVPRSSAPATAESRGCAGGSEQAVSEVACITGISQRVSQSA